MAIAAGRTRFKPQEQQPEPVVVAPPPKRKPGRRKKSERVAEPTRIVPAPRPPSRLTLGDLDFALGLGSINDQPLLDIIKATLTTD